MHKTLRIVPAAVAACLLAAATAGAALAAGDSGLTPPRIDSSHVNPTPLYPDDAQKRGEQGSVDLSVYISYSGHPTGALKVVRSSGFDDLDNSAIEAVLGWHYIPATDSGGDTHSAWMPVHVEFKLPPPPQSAPPASGKNPPA